MKEKKSGKKSSHKNSKPKVRYFSLSIGSQSW
jgi:hypothetical protein